jgi:aminodeoxyfutalosine synthase
MVMNLESIYQNLSAGKRLSVDDAVLLYRHGDILELAELATAKREALHEGKTYFIRNKHIDYSNVCAIQCKFCAFARKTGQEGSFELTIEQILEKIRHDLHQSICEVHIVGGFHPTHPYEFYTGMLKAIKKEFPQIHVKAFTASEIRYFAKKFRKTEETVLQDFMAAGLDSMPGGGAEILAPEVRKIICGPKGLAQYWLDTHELAHGLGLRSNATMLYGHIETLEDRVEHMSLVRDLQDKTGGFLSFIPLAFNPKDTEFESVGYTTGYDDLKTLAMVRLFFDNIQHIKAYWVMSGMEMAQVAQDFGADDLHGTVIEENITHMAGGQSPQGYEAPEICRLIWATGRTPVERDSLYREVKTYSHEILDLPRTA